MLSPNRGVRSHGFCWRHPACAVAMYGSSEAVRQRRGEQRENKGEGEREHMEKAMHAEPKGK